MVVSEDAGKATPKCRVHQGVDGCFGTDTKNCTWTTNLEDLCAICYTIPALNCASVLKRSSNSNKPTPH